MCRFLSCSRNRTLTFGRANTNTHTGYRYHCLSSYSRPLYRVQEGTASPLTSFFSACPHTHKQTPSYLFHGSNFHSATVEDTMMYEVTVQWVYVILTLAVSSLMALCRFSCSVTCEDIEWCTALSLPLYLLKPLSRFVYTRVPLPLLRTGTSQCGYDVDKWTDRESIVL